MSKILVVSMYPIAKPQHGGQRRVAAIVDGYKQVFDSVQFVSVFPPDYYQSYWKTDIALKGKYRKMTTDSPFTGDIICGEAIYKDPHTKSRFTKLLLSFQPDVIQIEQVFPYLGVKPLLEELGLRPKIILSSHNIEYIQKRDILNISGYAHEADEACKLIEACETDMAKNSDLVVAVSPDDAAALKKLGSTEVVIAPNGIEKYAPTERGLLHWRNYKKKNGLRKLATFVGSAHPPNWHGFLDMVGEGIGFMPPDTKLIMAGSISDYFKDTVHELTPEHATFWKRVDAAGRLSDELLTGLLAETDVLILPITEGGGSNLKTAEAILSGKKIVATSYAFRSFEKYLNLPNIYISDDPKRFRELIVEAFNSTYVERTKEQVQLADSVQWKYCLQPMMEGAKAI